LEQVDGSLRVGIRDLELVDERAAEGLAGEDDEDGRRDPGDDRPPAVASAGATEASERALVGGALTGRLGCGTVRAQNETRRYQKGSRLRPARYRCFTDALRSFRAWSDHSRRR